MVGLPFELSIHRQKNNFGNSKRISCPGSDICTICKLGDAHTPKIIYQVKILDRKDNNKLKILEMTPSLVKEIKDLATTINPLLHDMRIKRIGTGSDTTYAVKASPNQSPITAVEQALIDNPYKELVNMYGKIHSLAEISKLDLKVLKTKSTSQEDFDNF